MMEEKVLLKSKRKNYWIVFFIICCISFGFMIGSVTTYITNNQSNIIEYFQDCFSGPLFGGGYVEEAALLIISIALIIIALLIIWWLSKMEMVITNKRVYGKVAFGKRVDLPLDSISAVGVGALGAISIGTSSGRISFLIMKNNTELHKCINNLLILRQQKTTRRSDVEDLHKYKNLLDEGLISQEEFDAKKKQLLGI